MENLSVVLAGLEKRLAEIERRLAIATAPKPISVPKPYPAAALHPPGAVPKATSPAPTVGTGSFFGIVGIAFVLLAAVFFLKLTIDSGWLTPPRQVVLAALFGLLCHLLPHFVRRLADDYGGLLSGAGVAILHATWFGAFQIQHLIDAETALIAATGVGLLSILLNTDWGGAAFVFVAVAGTYLSAGLLGFHAMEFTTLARFFLIWNLSFSALGFFLRRRDVLLVAGWFAVGMVGLTASAQVGASATLATSFLELQGLQFVIFAAANTIFSVSHRQPLRADESWLVALLLLVFYASTYSLTAVIFPEIAPLLGVALALLVLALYGFARSAMETRLASTAAMTSFATLVLLHSVYFKLTPEAFKPGFSLGLAIALALALGRGPEDFWRVPLRLCLVAVGYGALLSFVGDFREELRIGYQFSFGVTALALASAALLAPRRGPIESPGALLLGFGHLEMLSALYRLSHRVEMSGTLFVSITWGLYALLILLWGYVRRDRVVGQSAILILAAVSLKAAFYDVLVASSLARVLSLLAAGTLLYACGWVYRQMRGWPAGATPRG